MTSTNTNVGFGETSRNSSNCFPERIWVALARPHLSLSPPPLSLSPSFSLFLYLSIFLSSFIFLFIPFSFLSFSFCLSFCLPFFLSISRSFYLCLSVFVFLALSASSSRAPWPCPPWRPQRSLNRRPLRCVPLGPPKTTRRVNHCRAAAAVEAAASERARVPTRRIRVDGEGEGGGGGRFTGCCSETGPGPASASPASADRGARCSVARRSLPTHMFANGAGRAMRPPGGESHDLFGAEFKGTPCHHRVLKPPGGGTSDIFGAPEPVQNSPRRVRNNMQSSVFGPASNGEVTPRKPGTDSHNRLFGPADARPQSATKNRLKSSILLSHDDSTSPTKDKHSNYVTKDSSTSAVDSPVLNKASIPRRNPVTGDGMYIREVRRSARKRDGNPVTGEGYTNGEKQPITNGGQPAVPTANGTSHSAPPQRNRVPPGGYSSGLW